MHWFLSSLPPFFSYSPLAFAFSFASPSFSPIPTTASAALCTAFFH